METTPQIPPQPIPLIRERGAASCARTGASWRQCAALMELTDLKHRALASARHNFTVALEIHAKRGGAR